MALAGQNQQPSTPWMAAALRQLSLGIIIADAEARPVYLNEAAGEIIAAENGLFLRDGLLAAHRGFETARLRTLIAGAAATASPAAQAQGMAIGGLSGSRFSIVVVAPLRPERGSPLPDAIADTRALLLIGQPQPRSRAFADLLPQIFGLTRAETRLALGLSQGKALARIAKDSHVTVPTLRVQLRSILKKTGATRQADIVRLVLSIPRLH